MSSHEKFIGNGAHSGLPTVERVGNALYCTLSRPQEHNRLDPLDIDHLQRVFDQVRLDFEAGGDGPRCVVLRGQGAHTFCSGFTISAIGKQLDDRFERMLDTLETLPVPTIAAIQGGVYGGGTDLALCCDVRLGVTGSRMFMPAARFAIHYYPGGLRRYVNNLGLAASKKLFLTGMPIDADEMLRIGFLTEVVDGCELDARVQAYVASIDETERSVVASMKDHLHRFAESRPDLPGAAHAARTSVQSPESRRRIAALKPSGRPGDES
ncbi:MAG: enoyl-CoA hydratase/isomerase family protein [Pseudomonadota bacterium]